MEMIRHYCKMGVLWACLVATTVLIKVLKGVQRCLKGLMSVIDAVERAK